LSLKRKEGIVYYDIELGTRAPSIPFYERHLSTMYVKRTLELYLVLGCVISTCNV